VEKYEEKFPIAYKRKIKEIANASTEGFYTFLYHEAT